MQHIAMLVFPKFTALDLIGPQAAFSTLKDVEIHLVWKTLDPITTDSGITLFPTKTFATCPEELAVLFVPGGGGLEGTIAMMEDEEVLTFLSARAEKASYVTSVCTGSLVLGAAGLLRGYKATSHWTMREVLPLLEAERVDARYVEDGNRITGGGITSGIDFGLNVVARLRDEASAQRTQLILEYAPDPPFQAGTPESAPAPVLEGLLDAFAPVVAAAKEAAARANARW